MKINKNAINVEAAEELVAKYKHVCNGSFNVNTAKEYVDWGSHDTCTLCISTRAQKISPFSFRCAKCIMSDGVDTNVPCIKHRSYIRPNNFTNDTMITRIKARIKYLQQRIKATKKVINNEQT